MTVQPSSAISKLPKPAFEKLVQAKPGPWLPLTLVLVYKLMQAVKQTGLPITVLNGGSPDNAHAVLGKVGLAPTSGIGNLALAVPPLKQALAVQFHRPPEHSRTLQAGVGAGAEAAGEPVAAEPVAAEPVAAEPVAVEPVAGPLREPDTC